VDRAADIPRRDKAQDRHLPVSGSTSTSQNCVEKPGAMPPALTEAAAVIGPPVSAYFAARPERAMGQGALGSGDRGLRALSHCVGCASTTGCATS
jgi:hypothetical protein